MAKLAKIDSNITGTSIAEEAAYGFLPGENGIAGTPDWYGLEPNAFKDFGGQPKTIARNPIRADRQRKKGAVVDLDAGGGFESDLLTDNLQRPLQGFMFADLRTKHEVVVASVAADGYTVTGPTGSAYVDGTLLFAKGFADAANNGLKKAASSTATKIGVAGLTVAAGQAGIVSRVGIEFAASDAAIDVTGPLPALKTTAFDLTTLGLIPGEWVFLGGDAAGTQFGASAGINNGYARVRSVAAHAIVFDKTDNELVADTATGKTIRMYFGRVLKNEADPSLQKRRTYQIERTLGAPDTSNLAQIQAEYVKGAVPNELSFNIAQANKITMELTYVGKDVEFRDAVTGPKSGNRYPAATGDAINTSSDVSRIRLARVSSVDAAPTPLFAFVTNISLGIKNNVTGNKAVGVLGNFECTAGDFEVDSSLTAYFSDVAAVQAVRDNADVTFDLHTMKNNTGVSVDMPLITLGKGRVTVEKDKPITLPLDLMASNGDKIDPNLNHTMLFCFFDYLPNLAKA